MMTFPTEKLLAHWKETKPITKPHVSQIKKEGFDLDASDRDNTWEAYQTWNIEQMKHADDEIPMTVPVDELGADGLDNLERDDLIKMIHDLEKDRDFYKEENADIKLAHDQMVEELDKAKKHLLKLKENSTTGEVELEEVDLKETKIYLCKTARNIPRRYRAGFAIYKEVEEFELTTLQAKAFEIDPLIDINIKEGK